MNRVRKGRGAGFVHEQAGLPGNDGFERAAASERDHRPPASLGLEGDDAEILLAGEQDNRGTTI